MLKDTSTGNRTSNLLITKRLLDLSVSDVIGDCTHLDSAQYGQSEEEEDGVSRDLHHSDECGGGGGAGHLESVVTLPGQSEASPQKPTLAATSC